ncbi:MAG: hypothetical protein AB4290_26140 [Spirulina sp.]
MKDEFVPPSVDCPFKPIIGVGVGDSAMERDQTLKAKMPNKKAPERSSGALVV